MQGGVACTQQLEGQPVEEFVDREHHEADEADGNGDDCPSPGKRSMRPSMGEPENGEGEPGGEDEAGMGDHGLKGCGVVYHSKGVQSDH